MSVAEQTRAISLILQQGGLLESSLETQSARTSLSVEDYIRRRIAAGATEEQVFDEIMEDLVSPEVSRLFGEYKTGWKRETFGATNIAATNAEAVEHTQSEMLRWQSNGVNVCPDCQERHGEVDTMESWMVRGLPAQFGSRCTTNCQCMLVPVGVELGPIQVGAE